MDEAPPEVGSPGEKGRRGGNAVRSRSGMRRSGEVKREEAEAGRKGEEAVWNEEEVQADVHERTEKLKEGGKAAEGAVGERGTELAAIGQANVPATDEWFVQDEELEAKGFC